MALINKTSKRLAFYKINFIKLPDFLCNLITEFALECGVAVFEIWEEVISEEYIYDEKYRKVINKVKFRRHYKDKKLNEFFAISYLNENISFKESTKEELGKLCSVKRYDGFTYFGLDNEIEISREKNDKDYSLEVTLDILESAKNLDKYWNF